MTAQLVAPLPFSILPCMAMTSHLQAPRIRVQLVQTYQCYTVVDLGLSSTAGNTIMFGRISQYLQSLHRGSVYRLSVRGWERIRRNILGKIPTHTSSSVQPRSWLPRRRQLLPPDEA